MKVLNVNDPTVTSGLRQKSFTIKANSKSFKILSSQIYTDKIGTAPRELGANAIDSHKKADVSKPFVVHLPNALEPYFSVRDFGTGMSKEKIETMYITYFDSDKNEDNESIGGLGLGSKSPFAYTDQFSVISYLNGNKYIYSAFMNNGLPDIAHIADEETTEDNGMEIMFAVKPEDFRIFESRCKKIYTYFSPKPVLVGLHDPKIPDIDYIGQYIYTYNGIDTKWGIRRDTNDYTANAIMGGIAYPISKNIGASQYDDLHRNSLRIIKCPIDIWFSIGELEVVASRESLEYNDETSRTLIKTLTGICNSIRLDIYNQVEACKTLKDACKKMAEMQEKYTIAIIRDVFPHSIQWKGVNVSDLSLSVSNIKHDYYDYCCHAQSVSHTQNVISASTYRRTMEITKLFIRDEYGLKIKTTKDINYISFHENTSFIINDLPKKSLGRCFHYLRTLNKKNHQVFIFEFDEEFKKYFFDKIGFTDSDFIKASTLTKPPVKKSDKKQNIINYYDTYKFRGHSRYNSFRDCWFASSPTSITDNIFIVTINNFELQDLKCKSLSHLNDIIKFYSSINNTTVQVYGISQRFYSDKLKKRSNWIEFIPHALDSIQNFINANNISEAFSLYETFKTYKSYYEKTVEFLIDVNNRALTIHDEYITQTSTDLHTIATKISVLDKYRELVHLEDFVVPVDINKNELRKKLSNIVQEYPLLEFYTPASRNHFCDYVNCLKIKNKK